MRTGFYLSTKSISSRCREANNCNIPYTTTLAAAKATLHALCTLKKGKLEVKSLQEYHEMVGKII